MPLWSPRVFGIGGVCEDVACLELVEPYPDLSLGERHVTKHSMQLSPDGNGCGSSLLQELDCRSLFHTLLDRCVCHEDHEQEKKEEQSHFAQLWNSHKLMAPRKRNRHTATMSRHLTLICTGIQTEQGQEHMSPSSSSPLHASSFFSQISDPNFTIKTPWKRRDRKIPS